MQDYSRLTLAPLQAGVLENDENDVINCHVISQLMHNFAIFVATCYQVHRPSPAPRLRAARRQVLRGVVTNAVGTAPRRHGQAIDLAERVTASPGHQFNGKKNFEKNVVYTEYHIQFAFLSICTRRYTCIYV